jgi:hypothetical protein
MVLKAIRCPAEAPVLNFTTSANCVIFQHYQAALQDRRNRLIGIECVFPSEDWGILRGRSLLWLTTLRVSNHGCMRENQPLPSDFLQ